MSKMIDPAGGAVAVTPSDSADLAGVRALFVGGAGNVAVTPVNSGTAVTFVGVTAGQILPVRARRVMSTNTTATDIVALT